LLRNPVNLARAVLLLALVFVVWRSVSGFELETDITRFLPEGEEQQRLALSRLVRSSGLAQSMLVDLELPDGLEDVEQAFQLSDAIADKMRSTGMFGRVTNKAESDWGEAMYNLYFPRRMALISDRPEQEIPRRFSEQGLAEALESLKAQLRLPSAFMLKRLVPADPLLLFTERMKTLQAQGSKMMAPLWREYFASADRKHLLIIARTRAGPMESAAQHLVMALMGDLRTEARADPDTFGGEYKLTYTGVNRFAVESEQRIKGDISWAMWFSSIGVILIFFVFYRRLRFLPLVIAPLGFGMAAALGVTLAVYGKIHGLTLAFGSTLLGISIDFPVHLLNHMRLSQEQNPGTARANWRRLHWSLTLGMGTTLIGFVILLVSEYPGVRQIALFGSVGVASAFLFAVAFLPLLRRWVTEKQPPGVGVGEALTRMADGVRRRRAVILVLLALAAVAAGVPAATGGFELEHDLRNLQAADPQTLADDAAIKSRLPGAEFSLLLFVSGDSLEQALQRNDALFLRLGRLQQEGRVAAFNSLHPLLPSQALQQRNLEALRAIPDLEQRFRDALVKAGFKAEAFGKLFEALAGVREGRVSLLDARTLRDTRLSVWTSNFLFERDGVHHVVTMVRAADPGDTLEGALGPEVTSFSEVGLASSLFSAFQQDAVKLILLGLIAITLVLLVYHRRLAHSLSSILPAILAAWLTLGLIAALGARINFLHVMSFLLVLCMGVDYGIFVADSLKSRGERELPVAVRSVALSALTTFFAFGVLGVCQNPALRAVGQTAGVGILLACVLAVVVNLVLTRGQGDA